jgi:hypothetical protein
MAVFGRNQEMSLKELQAHVAVVKAEIAGREHSETLSSAMLAPGCRHVPLFASVEVSQCNSPRNSGGSRALTSFSHHGYGRSRRRTAAPDCQTA